MKRPLASRYLTLLQTEWTISGRDSNVLDAAWRQRARQAALHRELPSRPSRSEAAFLPVCTLLIATAINVRMRYGQRRHRTSVCYSRGMLPSSSLTQGGFAMKRLVLF